MRNCPRCVRLMSLIHRRETYAVGRKSHDDGDDDDNDDNNL